MVATLQQRKDNVHRQACQDLDKHPACDVADALALSASLVVPARTLVLTCVAVGLPTVSVFTAVDVLRILAVAIEYLLLLPF